MKTTMKKIQMVDLKTQYEHIKTEVDAAIQQVINNTAFINGPEVKSFQSELEKYLGVKHVIPCANGTDALQITMMALNLQPGDEVITANFTYVATPTLLLLTRQRLKKRLLQKQKPLFLCIFTGSVPTWNLSWKLPANTTYL